MIVFFDYWNYTFAVFRAEGKFPVEKDVLAIKDVGLLSEVWNNFRNLLGMLEGPVDLLFFRFFISESTLSRFVGLIKYDCLHGFLKQLE